MALVAAGKGFLQHLLHQWDLRYSLELKVVLENEAVRQFDRLKRPVYTVDERITGFASVRSLAAFPLPCRFLIAELVAVISSGYGCVLRRWEVFSRAQTFDFPHATLNQHAVITKPFAFDCSELTHETYDGSRIRLGYCIRLRFCARADLSERLIEKEIVILAPRTIRPYSPGIFLNAGLENILHLELELDRRAYHLHDVIVGRLTFLDNRVMIRRVDIEIRREESGRELSPESELVGSFQILEGCPKPGAVVPIRLFLKQFSELTPTYADVCGIFSVRYVMRLVVTDADLRRFWKEHEIVLWRASDVLETFQENAIAPCDQTEKEQLLVE